MEGPNLSKKNLTPEEMVAFLRKEMGIGSVKKETPVVVENSNSYSPEENKKRFEAQGEAINRMRKIRKDVLVKAGLWEGYPTEEEVQSALQPTLLDLKNSGSIMDYLAFKSMFEVGQRFVGNTIQLRSVLGEDPITLQQAKTEILTSDQNKELDDRLNNPSK